MDTIEQMARGPQIMFVCDYCSEHNPEMCGYYDADQVRRAPSGAWLCENCYDEETDDDAPLFSDAQKAFMTLCSDCPPVGYPTDTTRCEPCPRRAAYAVAFPIIVEQCRKAYEAHDKTNREWVAGSLWDALNREGSARVRALADPDPTKPPQVVREGEK